MAGPDAALQRRLKAKSEPAWQRFQTELLAPSHHPAAVNNDTTTTTSKDDAKADVNPYQRQYSNVYQQRHMQLAPLCRKAFRDHMQNTMTNDDTVVQQVDRLLELEEDTPSFVVGALVKEPSPNTKDPGPPMVEGTECRATDLLYLEDESGRVALQFSKDNEEQQDKELMHIHQYCTGMIVGVQGQVNRGGSLLVTHVFPPKVAPPPLLPNHEGGPSPYVLLLSGLQCGSTTHSSLTRDMLLTFLEGRLSHPAAASVSRVVICGGSVALNTKDLANTTDRLRDLDAFLFQITAGAGVPVDLMPGQHDPTTANWPQRPLHSSLLLQSSNFGLVQRTPNPYASRLEGCHLLATDGRNVTSLQQHVLKPRDETLSQLTELEALRQQLECGHCCPTGPAAVPTVPHAFSDPMVLKTWPHVYVAGNCDSFATETVTSSSVSTSTQGCRLICVPSFAKTGEAVLLNLHTLKVELLRFEDE